MCNRKKILPFVISIALLLPAMGFSQFRVVGYVPASATAAAVLNDSIVKKLVLIPWCSRGRLFM
jgi:hypothetical protein